MATITENIYNIVCDDCGIESIVELVDVVENKPTNCPFCGSNEIEVAVND